MNRRSFMQIMAAAFATPAFGMTLPTQQYGDIRWDLFCDPEFRRYDIGLPWVHDGVTIASDSRVLITKPGGDVSGNGDRRVPKIPDGWFSSFDLGGWQPLNVMERVASKYDFSRGCEQCFGRGYLTSPSATKCECDGGYLVSIAPLEFDPDWIDCTKCRGTGLLNVEYCSHCESGRKVGEPYSYMFSDVEFPPAVIATIRTLGDCEIHSTDVHHGEVLAFRRSDGVRGLVSGVGRS